MKKLMKTNTTKSTRYTYVAVSPKDWGLKNEELSENCADALNMFIGSAFDLGYKRSRIEEDFVRVYSFWERFIDDKTVFDSTFNDILDDLYKD
jgi:hypothetical protein